MKLTERFRRAVFGPPKDVKDPEALHKISLIAILAWVGLGADGLSSSAYGPDEAFRALGEHTGLAIFLAIATALTVFIISYGYSRIIEQFPAGGGGYLVASKLLGPRIGVVSGSALLVDYVLTITTSLASGADQIFSFLPESMLPYKVLFAFLGLSLLTLMNLRGVRESITTISPIFAVFLLTHAVLLVAAIGGHLGDIGTTASEVSANVHESTRTLGTMGALALFVRAYSLGGGTYTGIEAVSNGMAMMREPRVQTAKRTMVLMAISLAVVGGGIVLAYLLVHATPEDGKTMNYVLIDRVTSSWHVGGFHVGRWFLVIALVSEGALLFVAAQAGFLDGPRVMANMATDSWLPHRFSALSERLTMRNGVILMFLASAGALVYTNGNVTKLVTMYSINVFLTFSLSNIAMTRFWVRHRNVDPLWYRHLPAHVIATVLCVTILGITVYEKFMDGGWLTVVVTSALTFFCFVVKSHYDLVVRALKRFDKELPDPGEEPAVYGLDGGGAGPAELVEPDTDKPVAVVFVGGYGGLGRHALLTLMRMFPGHFSGIVFASIAVVDSDAFKGAMEIEALEKRTLENLTSYRRFAAVLGLKSASAFTVGTEVAVEAEKLASELRGRYAKPLFVAGQIIFEEDTAWNRALHNETAFLIQRRLQHMGLPMIVLPVQLDIAAVKRDEAVGRRAKEKERERDVA